MYQIILALSGAVYGLAVSRLLYEFNPLRFAIFGVILPALGCSLLGAMVGVGIQIVVQKRSKLDILSENDLRKWRLLPVLYPLFYIISPAASAAPLKGGLLIISSLGLIIGTHFGETPQKYRRVFSRGAVALAGIIGGVYLLTLQRVVGRADTFEFQVTAPVMGVAHPTGYPLYLLYGKLISLLPLGSMATRVNLTSMIAAVLAVTLLYLILRRVLDVSPIFAIPTVFAFAFSPVFWGQAVVAEVYALHNVFVGLLLGGSMLLVIEGRQPDQPTWVPKLVIALIGLTGLSLTHHLTTILLIPSLTLAIIFVWPRLSWREWGLAALFFMLGLSVYAYIPIRWPALHDGALMPFGDFIAWITGSRFSGALQLRAWFTDLGRWEIVWRLLVDQYGPIGIGAASLGLIMMLRTNWRLTLITFGAFAAYVFYGLNYLVPDIDVFLIPMFYIQAIWIAYGLHHSIKWAWAASTRPFEDLVRWQMVAVTLVTLIPLSALWVTAPTFNWSDEIALETWGREVLSLPLAENSAILADSEKIAPLEYLHRIEGMRPDMSMVVLGTEDDYRAYLPNALAEGQTVYLQRYLSGLEGSYYLRSIGPLVEVGTEPLTRLPELDGGLIQWESGVKLLGHTLDYQESGQIWLTLYWQTEQIISDNYQIRLRFVDAEGQVIYVHGLTYAVSNRYPTVAWKVGEIIPDTHILWPWLILPEGDYQIEVALSPPFSLEIAEVLGQGEWASLGSITIKREEPTRPAIGYQTAISFEGGALTHVGVPDQIPADGSFEVLTRWKIPSGNRDRQVVLSSNGDRLGESPTYTFDPETGSLILSGQPMRCGWLKPLTEQCTIAKIEVIGEAVAQAVANFDNQILLVGVDFEAGRLSLDQPVDVTLHWQGLRQMTEDYTIFVHLLGPDGRVHGQIDQWPVQGTYPTSTWKPGDLIDDRYLVMLDPDSPSGSYQLEIGIYLLGTNTRLLILGEAGNPLDDKVLLGGLILPNGE